ncbi:amino acid permease, partial [Actinomadura geliboluensis]
MATALVVGNMIGSGVFLLPSSLAEFGPISLVAWGFTAAGAILLALVFARLSRAYPRTGGPYAYARRAFGDFVGFQTAWGYWIAVWAGNAAIAVAFVGYLAHFWPSLGQDKVAAAAVGVATIWLLTAVNAYGVREGGAVQVVTTVVKLVPLLMIAVGGLLFIEPGNFGEFNAGGGSAFGAVTAAAALTLWSFIGLESATVPAEDVQEPEKTIPRATVAGT